MTAELVGGKEFLERYFRDCAGTNVELRALAVFAKAPTKCVHQKAYTDIDALLADAGKLARRYNVFFNTVALNGGFTEDHAVACPALRIDIDFKNGITEAEARELLAAFPLPPSAIIRTGGGLHVYWILADPAGREDFGRVKAITKSLAFTFHADTVACDIPRILRLPGTVNRKPDYNPPRPVTLARADWHPEREYSLSDFAALLPIEGEIKQPPAEKMAEAAGDKLPIERLAPVFEKCAEIDGMRRNAIEGGRLLPENKPGEHLARIRMMNLYRAFDGGPDRAVQEIFSHLDDYDARETGKQIASLHGFPPPCAELCPAGQCTAIKALGKKSPIAFAYEARKEMRKPTVEVVTPPAEVQAPVVRDFPAEVMTGAAGAFAHLYSSYMESPKLFFYMAYLTCLGSYLSGSLTIDSEIRPQPRLYTLLLADSADDRKSTAISKTTSFFRTSIADFHMCRGVGSAEGLNKLLGGTGKKLLLSFDEFAAFVGKCKIESSVLLPFVNTLFEDNYYEARTKKDIVIMSDTHLSILAASTIATYERTWSPAFTDIGFNNRLWLVTGKGGRKFSCPRTIPEESKRLARSKLSAVLDHAAKHPVMAITDDARELYDNWYLTRPATIHGKRLDTYALRFMSLLAVNDLKPEVDVDTVKKVIALCDHQHHVRQLHDPVDADNVIAGLEEKIRRVLKAKGRVTGRDLKRALHVNQTGLWSYNAALDGLNKEKEIAFDKVHKVYFLRPEGVTTPVTTSL